MQRDIEVNPALESDQIEELLDDIEMRCSADLTAARDMATVRCKVAVEVRPGNSSLRTTNVVNGDTTELRSQSVTALTSAPLMVGDVYHLTFDRNSLDVAPALSVCDRCTMLGDSSFEVRFKFFSELALPAKSNSDL
ncbi:MAG: hypothetical protein NXI31_13140 [bacterium]|nr:hypothetical protein [bacterium]